MRRMAVRVRGSFNGLMEFFVASSYKYPRGLRGAFCMRLCLYESAWEWESECLRG